MNVQSCELQKDKYLTIVGRYHLFCSLPGTLDRIRKLLLTYPLKYLILNGRSERGEELKKKAPRSKNKCPSVMPNTFLLTSQNPQMR
jgi:hypothetical protein